jgi:hypothetical protein
VTHCDQDRRFIEALRRCEELIKKWLEDGMDEFKKYEAANDLMDAIGVDIRREMKP